MTWIKLEHVTPDKPEISKIADELNISADEALGKLIRLWIWADQQTYDGRAGSVTKILLDRVSGVNGFCESLLKCGWMQQSERDGFVFPNFDRHNGETAKARALNTLRKQKQRMREAETCRAARGTKARPEKRREDKIIKENIQKKKPRRFVSPTVEEVVAYARSIAFNFDGESFVDYYTAKGWLVGKSPMKDWRAAVRTWKKNAKKYEDENKSQEKFDLNKWQPKET